jgi:hypothetical protein
MLALASEKEWWMSFAGGGVESVTGKPHWKTSPLEEI